MRIEKDCGHAVNLLTGVVEIKAGARGAGKAQLSHQRLGAMMAAAQRETMLIGEGRQVVRMRPLSVESSKRSTVPAWAQHTQTGHAARRSSE